MRINRSVRVASPKEAMIFLVLGFIVSSVIIVAFQYGSTFQKNGTKNLTDVECTVVDIYTELDGRVWKRYTKLLDDTGREYTLKTTFKDHIGRKTVLSTTSTKAFRKDFELIRPVGPGWVIYLCPVFFLITLSN